MVLLTKTNKMLNLSFNFLFITIIFYKEIEEKRNNEITIMKYVLYFKINRIFF